MVTQAARTVAWMLAGLGVVSCGARTPLRVGDSGCTGAGCVAGPDVVADLGPDAWRDLGPDARRDTGGPEAPWCTPGAWSLTSRPAELILLVDRSGSMEQTFDDLGPGHTRSRWTALATELSSVLPPFESSIAMGVLAFPAPLATPVPNAECSVGAEPYLPPAFGQAAAISRYLLGLRPDGATPTRVAVLSAQRYFERHGVASRSRFLVLATDGGPNCLGGTGTGEDVPGTVAAVAGAARVGLPTFVIGIDDLGQPALITALDQIAVAGGRPNTSGMRSYYSVRSAAEMTLAFRTVQRAASNCVFALPSRPRTGTVSLDLDGTVVPQDSSHRDGWDWNSIDGPEVALFGPACDRVSLGGARARVTVTCADL